MYKFKTIIISYLPRAENRRADTLAYIVAMFEDSENKTLDIEEILSDESDGEGGKEEKKDNPRKHLKLGREVHVDDQAEGLIGQHLKLKASPFRAQLLLMVVQMALSTLHLQQGERVLTLEESKEADTTTGKAAHRVSRGIYDKMNLMGLKNHGRGMLKKYLPDWNEGFNTQGNVERRMKHVQLQNAYNRLDRPTPQTQSFTFQSSTVTYGGPNGAYYTSSTTRRAGGDGLTLEESKEADTITGKQHIEFLEEFMIREVSTYGQLHFSEGLGEHPTRNCQRMDIQDLIIMSILVPKV
ncbi:hypothetical protein GIB67_036352 [Kingdonia uniflora]|uniref:Uncharacterized protein n=1 Tax=Kingdonia uniflora TaxID=39325 RepID=A0A7J7L3W1_9MAGN|nr:hypothetical protein GIB67_036352 [Kingdonia uniflora]